MVDQTSELNVDVPKLKRQLAQLEAELAVINSVQQGLAMRASVQSIYDLVGDKIRDIFDAQVVMISTYDQLTNTVEHRYAIERGQRVISTGSHAPGGFRTQIIQTRQPILVNSNVAQEAARRGQPTLPGTTTPKSWLGVPMIIGAQVTGVLSLQNVELENAFKESDLRLLQTLAASMSLALENARLWEQESLYRKALEREFEIGREIQAGFLPDHLPQPEGWEIAASLRPAREVAGDFYDAFELPDGNIGLVIADVCDKGLGAALFMTLFRSLLRAVSNIDFYARVKTKNGHSPASRIKNALSLTNNYIVETHGSTGMFATIFFGILDPLTGLLTYANAGHLPPLLIDKKGVKKILQRTGPAIGVLPDADYAILRLFIRPGDTFFAYTDGLTDSTNPSGEYFNALSLIDQLSESQALHPQLAQIQAQIEHFSAGEKQFDDITLLAIRHK
jgi:sigma-B regulation protein RsbU (phosphoserine phosphatase)